MKSETIENRRWMQEVRSEKMIKNIYNKWFMPE